MGRQLVIANANSFEALGAFACRHSNYDRLKPGFSEAIANRLGKMRRNVRVRNDCATRAQLESSAGFAESGQQSNANPDVIAAVPEGYFDAAHRRRMAA